VEFTSCSAPQISHPNVAQGSYKELEEWYELFSRGQALVVCLSLNRSRADRQKQRATQYLPIFAEGKFWGVIGFDDCRERNAAVHLN